MHQCRVIHLLQSKVTAKPCQTTAMMLCTLSTGINTWNTTRKTKVGPRELSVYISFPLCCRFLVNCMDLALFPDGYQILRLLDTNMISRTCCCVEEILKKPKQQNAALVSVLQISQKQLLCREQDLA